MKYEEFKLIFEDKEKEINLNVSDENIKKLYEYMMLLLEWNEKINLTAITDLNDIRDGASKGSTALQSEVDPIYTADKPNFISFKFCIIFTNFIRFSSTRYIMSSSSG